MKHFFGLIFLTFLVNNLFCDNTLFVAEDYYNLGNKKIVRYSSIQYQDGSYNYNYVLSLYEDINFEVEIAYRAGHIYIIAYYKNLDFYNSGGIDEIFY
jgi:hypothetical protein